MLLPYAPWLCWFLPVLGSGLTLVFSRVSHKFRDFLAVASVGLVAVFSFSMFPDVLAGAIIDWQIPWTNPELGVLIELAS